MASESENDAQQLEEIEVLTSIYPVECEVVQADPPRSLKISLVPHPPGGEECHVGISLMVSMPAGYPSSSPPELLIQIEKGLSRKHAEELKIIADRAAASDPGMPAIFLVCEALKEWMCDNNTAGQDGSMYSEMMRREQRKDTDLKRQEEKKAISAAADHEMTEHVVDPEEEERIRRRQAGQPVTVESFMAWKVRFDEEMRLASGASASMGAAAAPGAEVRLSGKQLFLLNKAGQEDGEDLLAAAEAGDDEGADFFDEDCRKTPAAGGGYGEEDEEDEDDEDYVPGEDDEDDDDEDDEDWVDESEEA